MTNRETLIIPGGGANAIQEVASRFASNNKVTVLCGNFRGAKNRKVEGVYYKHIGLKIGPKLGQLVFQLMIGLQLLITDFDIWIENFTPPFSTALLPLLTKKPVIGLCHMLAGKDMARKYKIPFDAIERVGLRYYKYFICVNEKTAKYVSHINKDAIIRVIPNGVNTPKLKGKKDKYILFLGRLDVDQKGLDLLLKAFKPIHDTDIKLRIAGDGTKKEREKLIKLIFELRLADSVIIEKYVRGATKDKLLMNAQIVVVPSRYETFSMVALEALAYGTPLVCFDIDGLSWIPEEICWKVKNFDEKGLTDRINEIISKPLDARKKVRSARAFAKKYDWDDIYDSYKVFVKELLPDKHTEEINKEVNRIISKKTKCVFVSPHLDDAVLSAGKLLNTLSGKVPVEVVNVFTRADKPMTVSAKFFMHKSGFKDLNGFYNSRRKEDETVLRKLGVKITDLELVDAIFRKDRSVANPIRKGLATLIPEVDHIYPIFKLHVLSGKISNKDKKTYKILDSNIKKHINGNKNLIVFCPLGNSKHVDHLMVRNVVSKNFKNPIYWNDFPYPEGNSEIRNFTKVNNLKKYVYNMPSGNKNKLIKGYKSQYHLLSKLKGFKDMNEYYYMKQ